MQNGASVTPGSTCWSDAPAQVPAFLSYLAKLGAGMSAYQLDGPTAGYLLKASRNWTDTTNYTDASWQPAYCEPGRRAPLLGGRMPL